MIISFTGTQKGMTPFQKDKLYESLQSCSEIIHGDCIGADAEANEIAIKAGVKIFSIYPSCFNAKRAFSFNLRSGPYGEWITVGDLKVRIFPPKMPLERNADIIRQGHKLIACPRQFKHTLRSGTWATIRIGWRLKKPVSIIPPIVREDSDGNQSDT